MKAERCETCRFGTHEAGAMIWCRRRAPTIFPDEDTKYAQSGLRAQRVWPVMQSFDWCGDWQAQPPQT